MCVFVRVFFFWFFFGGGLELPRPMPGGHGNGRHISLWIVEWVAEVICVW